LKADYEKLPLILEGNYGNFEIIEWILEA